MQSGGQVSIKSILRKMLAELFSTRPIAVAVLLTMAVAIAGPFSTFILFSIPERVAYWGLVVFLSLTCSALVRAIANELWPDGPVWRDSLAVLIGMPIVLTPLLVFLTRFVLDGTGWMPPGMIKMGVYIGIVSAVVGIIRLSLKSGSAAGITLAEQTTEEGVQEAPFPRLHQRLPTEAKGRILRLSADNHFVLIHTEKGAHQVRMRFNDAIAEMDAVLGYCAHRSHWVVAAAVESAEREGAKLFLRMVDGALVPVSRKYRATLEQAGLITV